MEHRTLTIIDALQDRHLFGGLPAFTSLRTWSNWIVFLKSVYGLALSTSEQAIYRKHTGRSTYNPPPGGFPEVCSIVGVQSGKSIIASMLADHAALTGEKGTHALLLCQDQRSSMRVLLKYAREPFQTLEHFRAEVVRDTADTLELANGVSLSAYPCRPEAVRGIRACIVCIDELAFFESTDGRPTDTEMLRVARGRVATTGGKIIILSSPYGQSGALWDLHRKHYGKDDSTTLIWQASAPDMNPTLSRNYLDRMAQDDPDAYRSEVLGEFRAGITSLLDPEALHACVDVEVRERPRPTGANVVWFWDSASGSGQDRFVIAGAHHDPQRDLAILDVVRWWSPPFNPGGVIAEAAALMKQWGCTTALGDKYAPGFVQEHARAHGIRYEFSDRDRSQLYLELLPLVNTKQVRLLDVPELLRELRGLERRRGPSGRDKVDHRTGSHDDLANACSRALVNTIQRLVPGCFVLHCSW